jgi:phosphoribosylformimino-5-aminoimidazole carboxamide ribotide isomerase
MILVPAIDIRGGRAVRLTQGAADRETVYSGDPVATARAFVAAGARRLHVVDLDGAFAGRSVHGDLIGAIAAVGADVQAGGGIRDLETLDALFARGARWAILGTAAIEDPELVAAALARHGDRIIVGIDARDGQVAIEGWAKASDRTPEDVARRVRALGARRAIYTNIARDGMLAGPDLAGLARLAAVGGLALTASGGIATIEHLRALRELEPLGVDSCIVGKALYEGRLDLRAALSALA